MGYGEIRVGESSAAKDVVSVRGKLLFVHIYDTIKSSSDVSESLILTLCRNIPLPW